MRHDEMLTIGHGAIDIIRSTPHAWSNCDNGRRLYIWWQSVEHQYVAFCSRYDQSRSDDAEYLEMLDIDEEYTAPTWLALCNELADNGWIEKE